jgi:antitoxin component HigA of HigAB toxin-antitoxin module
MTRIENEAQYNAAMERIEELLPVTTEETWFSG